MVNFSIMLEWKELKKIEDLPLEKKRIVFYAENLASFNHYKLLIEQLTNIQKITICYVTSAKNDKIFQMKNPDINAFYIGEGTARTKFFLTLKATILIMDMPDLERFHIKKSKIHPVHYVYLFHSIFSSHTYLRKGALDDFDTIFCVGQHHIDEIRETEKIYNLKQKNLIKYGYGRLDQLLAEREKYHFDKNERLIIIAPSYGKSNLLEICGIELIKILLEHNYQLILRPHFRILKDSKKLIDKIEKKFSENKNFVLVRDVIKPEDFHSSICMITDWSGIGLEYSFTTKNKVFFIDVPQKIINSEFRFLSIEPIEKSIRSKIGRVISPRELKLIPELILEKNESPKIESIMKSTVFNVKKSAETGANFLRKMIDMD